MSRTRWFLAGIAVGAAAAYGAFVVLIDSP